MILQYTQGQYGALDDTFFIVVNPIGITGKKINFALDRIQECRITMANDIENLHTILIALGAGILMVVFVGIVLYSLSADKSINYLWEYFRLKTRLAYSELSQNIKNRIENFHDGNEGIEKLRPSVINKSVPIKYRHSLRLIFRFFIMLGIAMTGYIYSIEVISNSINDCLSIRPRIIRAGLKNRDSLIQLYFWATEFSIKDAEFGLFQLYPQAQTYSDIYSAIKVHSDNLMEGNQIFKESEVSNFFTSEIRKSLYEFYSNTSYLQFGIISSIDYFVFESMSIINDGGPLGYLEQVNFISTAQTISQALETVYLDITLVSKNYIQSLLNFFLTFEAVFCLILILSYLIYFRSYLAKEAKVLKVLKKLLNCIPTLRDPSEKPVVH